MHVMDSPIEIEFRYYLAHQDELIEKYRGKFIVIHGQKVIGAYDNEKAAIQETVKKHELGTFIVQKAAYGSSEQVFRSRVMVG